MAHVPHYHTVMTDLLFLTTTDPDDCDIGIGLLEMMKLIELREGRPPA